jgi:hypothetical protein
MIKSAKNSQIRTNKPSGGYNDYKIIETWINFWVEEVKAHCDIPCGIYDPITRRSLR